MEPRSSPLGIFTISHVNRAHLYTSRVKKKRGVVAFHVFGKTIHYKGKSSLECGMDSLMQFGRIETNILNHSRILAGILNKEMFEWG